MRKNTIQRKHNYLIYLLKLRWLALVKGQERLTGLSTLWANQICIQKTLNPRISIYLAPLLNLINGLDLLKQKKYLMKIYLGR